MKLIPQTWSHSCVKCPKRDILWLLDKLLIFSLLRSAKDTSMKMIWILLKKRDLLTSRPLSKTLKVNIMTIWTLKYLNLVIVKLINLTLTKSLMRMLNSTLPTVLTLTILDSKENARQDGNVKLSATDLILYAFYLERTQAILFALSRK